MKIEVHISAEGNEEIGKLASALAAFDGQSITIAPPKVEIQPETHKPGRGKNAKVTEDKPAKEDPAPAKPEEEPAEPAKPADPEKQYTEQQVRSKLAALAKAGKQKDVKAILNSFGVKSLPEIKSENYADIMDAAAKLEG